MEIKFKRITEVENLSYRHKTQSTLVLVRKTILISQLFTSKISRKMRLQVQKGHDCNYCLIIAIIRETFLTSNSN